MKRNKIRRAKRLYEKRNGKYVQVPEYRLTDTLPYGWHLLHVQPTSKSFRFNYTAITPDRAKVLCALREVEDILAAKIMEASKLRIRCKPIKLTPKQKTAWENLIKIMGKEAQYLEFASVQEIVESSLAEFAKNIEEGTIK